MNKVLIQALLGVLCAVHTSALFRSDAPTAAEQEETDRIRAARLVEDKDYWYQKANEDLVKALNSVPNTNVAKNVVMFLGDGMSTATITAARIYKGQQMGQNGEEYKLTWEDFPNTASIKTYVVDKQVPDSASTATAYLCGVKTNYYTVGIDATGQYENCSSVTDDNKVYSVAAWALDAGKRAGVVTSTRVTHATPSALYAHSPTRDWECNTDLPADVLSECPQFKDIARQLIEDFPGKDLNVVLGGGMGLLTGDVVSTEDDPVDAAWDCIRTDGRDLFLEWQDNSMTAGRNYAAVTSKSELLQSNPSSLDYLMGIFSNAHMQYEWHKRQNNLDVPTLAEMTSAAIEVLQRGPDGFFLLVEGGMIDWAHHDNFRNTALDEAAALDDAIQVALDMLDLQETLIVVTSDHSHSMHMNGYPARGNNITGRATLYDDDLPISTLAYSSGPGYDNTYETTFDVNGTAKVTRRNITNDDFSDFSYEGQSAAPRGSSTHSGEDVFLFATGPMAHLFQGTHEQSYIAHVMGYAACIGPNQDHCLPSKQPQHQ